LLKAMNNMQLVAIRKFWIMALSLVCGLYGMPTFAAESEATSARDWLGNLETALEKTSYRGVFVYARGVEVNAMRIIHRYRNGTVTERLSQLDGDNGEIIRHGNEVVCILPNRGRLELDAVIPAGPFAGAFTDRLKPMSRWYRPHKLDDGRIAGFDAVVIAVTAKDRHRYSYRLWLERETGLLLKSQVRDRQGEVLERFQFTQLEITDDIADSELEVPHSGKQVQAVPGNEDAEAPTGEAADSDARSWQLGWTPDGFVAFTDMGDERFRLAAFSDGMASFSVFVEPMGGMDMPVGASRIGATTAYLHKIRSQEHVYLVTVVGEVPPETAMRVAESVTFTDPVGVGND
jgi:sigma-E factor negative regulatory protein RseB